MNENKRDARKLKEYIIILEMNKGNKRKRKKKNAKKRKRMKTKENKKNAKIKHQLKKPIKSAESFS